MRQGEVSIDSTRLFFYEHCTWNLRLHTSEISWACIWCEGGLHKKHQLPVHCSLCCLTGVWKWRQLPWLWVVLRHTQEHARHSPLCYPEVLLIQQIWLWYVMHNVRRWILWHGLVALSLKMLPKTMTLSDDPRFRLQGCCLYSWMVNASHLCYSYTRRISQQLIRHLLTWSDHLSFLVRTMASKVFQYWWSFSYHQYSTSYCHTIQWRATFALPCFQAFWLKHYSSQESRSTQSTRQNTSTYCHMHLVLWKLGERWTICLHIGKGNLGLIIYKSAVMLLSLSGVWQGGVWWPCESFHQGHKC